MYWMATRILNWPLFSTIHISQLNSTPPDLDKVATYFKKKKKNPYHHYDKSSPPTTGTLPPKTQTHLTVHVLELQYSTGPWGETCGDWQRAGLTCPGGLCQQPDKQNMAGPR